MTIDTPLGECSRVSVCRALRKGHLRMNLGPFVMALKAPPEPVVDFLFHQYAPVPVSLVPGLSDFHVAIRRPRSMRGFWLRDQLVADPGFALPSLPLPVSMAPLVMEMAMNAAVALKCWRLGILHAGVVEKNGRAVVISAPSGGGKSTLTLALMTQGWRLLSDEFALFRLPDGLLLGYPRPVSLKNESVTLAHAWLGESALSNTYHDTPKGSIAYRRVRPEDVTGAGQAVTAAAIVFPQYEQGSDLAAVPVPRSDAFLRLVASSTNYHLLGRTGFEALKRLTGSARAYELSFSNALAAARHIEEDLTATVPVAMDETHG